MVASFSDIPILDLSRAENASSKPAFLRDLRHALLHVGFIYIKNHGVPHDTVSEIQKLLPELFALPPSQKDEVALLKSPHFLGYSKFGSEVTAKTRDEREQFEFATELPDVYGESANSAALYTCLHGPNQWPTQVKSCRAIVETYIKAMTELSIRFLCLIAEALNLPKAIFLPFLSRQHRLKLVHGVGPHKDSSGWLTFLLQASDPSIRGLQALNKTGAWIDVPAVPDTFVVNMGQAFEAATNGVCRATTHRVLLPPGEYDRYSVPFFQGVRLDLGKGELRSLWRLFEPGAEVWQGEAEAETETRESEEGRLVDSPFLRGQYETWGESQLRTKIRSHRDVGRKYYADVFERYVNDDV